MSVDYSKLKTNLSLIMHRLKLVEKKKMELNQKARKTIGEFLNAGKVDRARIRVEQIIREDYLVEAMDLIESYCDLLLSRFGQLQASETVDDGLATAVSSLIWITPRLESDVPELGKIAEQLGRKYGKEYVQAVRNNTLKTVNETLIRKMGTQVPPKVLVEKYLVEIAKDQKIDYKADPKVMKEQEALNSAGLNISLSDSDDDHNGGNVVRQPSEAPQGGFNLIDLGDHYPRNPITSTYNPYGQPPPLPSEPPADISALSAFDSQITQSDVTDASAPAANTPIGFNLPNVSQSSVQHGPIVPGGSSSAAQLPSASDKAAASLRKATSSAAATGSTHQDASEGPPPNYDSVVSKPSNTTQYYSFGPESSFAHQSGLRDEDPNDTLPELPPVPKESSKDRANEPSHSSLPDERLDFDDLTRRFEELKNKKS